MKNNVSEETRNEAMRVAKATQKPGQTKEQTKLIAQGIEKGIAEYKKQQKVKARERDKARKQQQKAKTSAVNEVQQPTDDSAPGLAWLPWALLALSWLGFISLYVMTH
ncbi:DUF2956 domain-containing protein [Shewanella corallii]|uniref:DUF2956 domain-containing protein n=1 Tax=Shewanella corallii TaxID=560080 RepID=A0ABT0N2M5_9GAMM|nr:DUF2956 domain-containing protein [Shewanella corallii]MCL2912696.1 DUF2956 domain-containing protein [Shewanella corallii]